MDGIYFSRLPLDITLDILTRLPAESVLECKSVCKTWNNVVRHPSFSKMHFHRQNNPSDDDSGELGFLAFPGDGVCYYFEFNDDKNPDAKPIQRIRIVNSTDPFWGPSFVGSCNGLICFARRQFVWVWNPINREYVALPEIDRDCCTHSMYRNWTTGFGYVSLTDEYKTVRVYGAETQFLQVYIYTLGSGKGWRNLGKFTFELGPYIWLGAGIFAHEALYWRDTESKMITTFDLADEKFCENLSPPPLPPSTWDNHKIGVLNGYLSFTTSFDDKCYDDIWLLKKENDNRDKKEGEEHQSLGWSKQFRIPNGELLAVTKSGGVLTYGGSYLNICNTETLASNKLAKFNSYLLQVSRHKKTLISLKELGEDIKTMESAEIQESRSRNYSILLL